eukprot:GFUD01012958.1.p1 GENE.GFUD01012958.1~~GFUD01012958.1.p1  ORF type:complete len:713 (+),score=131.48 GFUD01012958.1:34-2139(+)
MSKLATILCLSQVVKQAVGWSYHSHLHTGPGSWQGVCASGVLQSPVDIVPQVWENLPAWSFNNYKALSTFSITNNGHTAKIYMTMNKTISISGGGLPGKFIFAQGHFHWGNNSNVGSEHLIGGRAFPLELHLVHYNSKYLTLQEAVRHKDGLAVVAILFELTDEDNPALSVITDMTNKVKSPDQTAKGDKKTSLKSFLPRNPSSFYRYSGSLTTPTCDEVVTWTVLHNTGTVSEHQLGQLRDLLDSHGYAMGNNYRPRQSLNNRTILASGVLSSESPLGRTEEVQNDSDDLDDVYDAVRDENQSDNDTIFLVTMTIIVLFTQCGFVFLEAGAVRSTNTMTILTRNWLAASCGALVYWAFGFGVAWGEDVHSFAGASYFFGVGVQNILLSRLFFEFTFALTASTLVSGALSERCSFRAFIIYNVLFIGIVFPMISHWSWHSDGWLSQNGFYDFSGSAVVHLSGASCALAGCWMLGPRANRFQYDKVAALSTHSAPLSALGGFILIFGYIAQNAGKQNDGTDIVPVVVNTAMASCVAALSAQMFNQVLLKNKSMANCCMNGALSGAVAICAGCDVYSTWASMVIGLLAGPLNSGASRLLLQLKIDDPVDAIAVNGAGGILGCLCVPLLREDGLGLFYTWSSQAAQLFLWNVLGVFIIIIWTGGVFVLIFYFLNKFKMLRTETDDNYKVTDLQKPGEEVPLTGA